MTPAWWIHLANYILQYPYQKHRPHISLLVTQPTSLYLGGWLEISIPSWHLVVTGGRILPVGAQGTLGQLGRSRVCQSSAAEAWGPMFWYQSRSQIRGRKWLSSRHPGKSKGPELLSLASQKIRSYCPVHPSCFWCFTTGSQPLWPVGRQEETSICMHGKHTRELCCWWQWDRIRSQSPLLYHLSSGGSLASK